MIDTSPSEFPMPADWVYRGEGNCNLVISLPRQKKILRIRKMGKRRSIIGWLIDWIADIFSWCGWNTLHQETRDLAFYKKVIRPLIGFRLARDGKQVFLSRTQVRVLERKLDNQRPDFRKTKQLQYGRATLFDDYAFIPDENCCSSMLSGDTYAVEIKPKQGWIPSSERHFPKCIFCMNQYLKRDSGRIKSLSCYCPLDLFSGEKTRMVRALRALIMNPQNNLNVFKNGSLVYGEHHKNSVVENVIRDIFDTKEEPTQNLLLEFCCFLQKCLTVNLESQSGSNSCSRKLFCEGHKIIQDNSVGSLLPKGSVLERILSIQMLDVKGNQYYYELMKNRKLQEFEYVDAVLKKISTCEGACLRCTVMMLSDRKDDLVFVPYLISSIAKDCSLMVTFRKVMEPLSDSLETNNVVCTKYGDFVVNIGVFDLYPKPMSTVLKHRKRIRKLMEISSEVDKSPSCI